MMERIQDYLPIELFKMIKSFLLLKEWLNFVHVCRKFRSIQSQTVNYRLNKYYSIK